MEESIIETKVKTYKPIKYKLVDLGNLVYYKNKQGIYKITNECNDKIYIGQSINLYNRFQWHVWSVNYDLHKERHLNKAYNKYGIDKFYVEVIEEVNIEDREELKNYLNEREIYYISYYDSMDNGYNCTGGGDYNPSYSEKVVKKRTQTLLYNEEVNKKLQHKGEDNPRAKLTDEMVIEIRERYGSGESRGSIYKDYKHVLSYSAFQYAMYGKTWKHLEPSRKPEKTGHTLTSSDVYTMREMYMGRKYMVKEIAEEFGVTSKHASRVLNMGRWNNEESIPDNYIDFLEDRNN